MKFFSILILVVSMFISIQANDNNIINENTSTQKTKARVEALKYDNSIKLKSKKDAYPGVEWKPKNSKPILERDLKKNQNTYPGVEWTPKK